MSKLLFAAIQPKLFLNRQPRHLPTWTGCLAPTLCGPRAIKTLPNAIINPRTTVISHPIPSALLHSTLALRRLKYHNLLSPPLCYAHPLPASCPRVWGSPARPPCSRGSAG